MTAQRYIKNHTNASKFNMGITNFHKMIKLKYPTCFQKKWLQNYDHVYIDINYALHYCSHNAKNEDEVFARLFNFFDNIFQELVPTKTTSVCSDGVAPLAKLILQRKRRLSISRGLLTDDEFSSLVFTPGTTFMTNLKNNLKNYLEYIEKSYTIKVNYLDHEIDEAELKLKHELMCNIKKYPKGSHVVVTNDADVIVMLTTLNKSDLHNVFVFCRNNYQNEILSIGKMLDLHTNDVGTTINYNLDFALVSIMMGNDYIPKIGLADFDKLWNSYKEICVGMPEGLTNFDLTINQKFFIRLLHGVLNLSKNQFIKKVTLASSFAKLYENYLDGLTWCLDTYHTGKCIRYDYMYEYPDCPHPLGIILNVLNNPNLLKHNKNVCLPISSSLYAILVLPNFAQKLVNKKYHKFMEKNDILYREEKCKKCLEFHDDLKKSNAELTELDKKDDKKIDEIKNTISQISKRLMAHKKNHDVLTLDDIRTISSNFENYCVKIK